MRLPFVIPFIVLACEPSDAAYIEAAKEDLAKGCCGSTADTCDHCPVLEGAKVVSSNVERCCAGAGKQVHFIVEGPNGKAACTFQIMKAGVGAFHSNGGGCHRLTPEK